MSELEIANRTIDTLYICAYVGFALWGIAGWYVGRYLLRTRYIKPNGLINMRYVRQVQDENLRLDNKIRKLEKTCSIKSLFFPKYTNIYKYIQIYTNIQTQKFVMYKLYNILYNV